MVNIMKKALIVATVSGFVPQFELDNVDILQKMDYEVHYASNFNVSVYEYDRDTFEKKNIIKHQIDFVRSPYAITENIKVYRQLKKLIKTVDFDLIHCHTPMGGCIARLAAGRHFKGKIIYTAHGFHFYKGASLKNWLLYYPVEKYLSRNTDCLITINKEDNNRAKKFHSRKIMYVPGVGIDISKINSTEVDRENKLRELNIPANYNIILSVGELIKRKNYEIALKAFAAAGLKNTVYIICGNGAYYKKLKEKAYKLNVDKKVFFLGYRKDIYEIMKCADVFFFPSRQEGLSLALMEAMAAGLPVVCSNIRGNVDLIKDAKGGFLYRPMDVEGFSKALLRIISDPDLAKRMGNLNRQAVAGFEKSIVRKMMEDIYRNIER